MSINNVFLGNNTFRFHFLKKGHARGLVKETKLKKFNLKIRVKCITFNAILLHLLS